MIQLIHDLVALLSNEITLADITSRSAQSHMTPGLRCPPS